MRFALFALLAVAPIFAAGTCDGGSTSTPITVTKLAGVNPPDQWVIHIRCIADAADGSYPNTTLPQSGLNIDNTDGLYLYSMISDPGSPAPTDNWDAVAIATTTNLDMLGGNGADRDTSNTEIAVPATVNTIFNGPTSFRISGNSVNSAVIVVDLYLLRTGALRAGAGSGGGVTSLAATSPITTTGATGSITIACPTCATSAAPVDATYITQTANATLTNEQAMGALATGLVKNTTTTGVQSIVVPGTGVETWIAAPSSANLAAAVTGETGSGALVFATSPTLVSPVLGTATGTSLELSLGRNLVFNSGGFMGYTGNGILSMVNGSNATMTRAVLGPDTSGTPGFCPSTNLLRIMEGGACTTFTEIQSNAFVGGGTSPSVGTCGTIGTGSTNAAGFITSDATGSCVSVMTFNGYTAPTGWSCAISNGTTANLITQTGSSTTTATFTGTTVSGDVLRYACTAY